MTETLKRMPRSENFYEHSADFGHLVAQSVNTDVATILFMKTRPMPAIKNLKDQNKGTVQIEVAVETELQHSCTVTIPRAQLEALKNNIEEFLANNNA